MYMSKIQRQDLLSWYSICKTGQQSDQRKNGLPQAETNTKYQVYYMVNDKGWAQGKTFTAK